QQLPRRQDRARCDGMFFGGGLLLRGGSGQAQRFLAFSFGARDPGSRLEPFDRDLARPVLVSLLVELLLDRLEPPERLARGGEIARTRRAERAPETQDRLRVAEFLPGKARRPDL